MIMLNAWIHQIINNKSKISLRETDTSNCDKTCGITDDSKKF